MTILEDIYSDEQRVATIRNKKSKIHLLLKKVSSRKKIPALLLLHTFFLHAQFFERVS